MGNIRKKRKDMKAILLTVIYLILTVCTFATPHTADRIIYKGKEFKLFTNPLEILIEKNPNMEPRIAINDTTDLLPEYYVNFEIQDKQLFVKDIVILNESYHTELLSLFNKLFPNQNQVKADWFTGLLVLPCGKQVNYVHMGYATTYENYILLEINKGNLIQEMKMKSKEYEKFKDKQFAAYKKTDKYKKWITDLKKEGDKTDEFLDSFLKIFLTDYTTIILPK